MRGSSCERGARSFYLYDNNPPHSTAHVGSQLRTGLRTFANVLCPGPNQNIAWSHR
jgi:hypothetical protein